MADFFIKFDDILTFLKKWQYFCHLEKRLINKSKII